MAYGNKKKRYLLAGMAFCFCLLLSFEVWKITANRTEIQEEPIYSLISSAVASVLFLLLIIYSSYADVLRIGKKKALRHLLFALPCFAVAMNNFPILPFFSGRAYILGEGRGIFVYLLSCLGTGLFEELVFRGYILMVLLEKRKGSVKRLFESVILSSALFGLIHLVNLFAGADPLSTLLQVGYSFLVGGMCAIVLIKTGSIWYSVLLHAIYNFAGGVIPRFGGGTIWDVPTVILTALLSVAVAIYLIVALAKTDPSMPDFLNE